MNARTTTNGTATLIDFPARPSGADPSSMNVCVHQSGQWTMFEVVGETDRQVVDLVAELIGIDAESVAFDLHREPSWTLVAWA